MAEPKLSKLELQIMEALWGHGKASIREIQETFPEKRRPAYTTVQTTVYRLEAKAPIYDELLRRHTPVVLLGHRAPFCDKFANVEAEDAAASHAATRHLLELGHKRIAFLSGPPAAPR